MDVLQDLRKNGGPRSPRSAFILPVCLLAGVGLGAVLCSAGRWGRTHDESYEAAAIAGLKTLVNAQAIWRSNDIDKNGVQDHWVHDVAGLYALEVQGKGPVQQIPFELAQADPVGVYKYPKCFPNGPVPFHGYYFHILPPAELKSGWAPANGTGQTGVVYRAYPAEVDRTLLSTFIMSEAGALWRSNDDAQ